MIGTDPRQSRDETRVLVYVQLKRRDLYGMRKIAAALATQDGFSVRLSGTSDFPIAVLAFQPHIVIFGKPDNAEGDWLRCMSGCTVVSMNPEQGGDPRERVMSNFFNKLNSERDQALDLIDHHLIVDEQTKNFLTPYLDPDRLHLVGYPRLFKKYFARTANPVNDKLVIGVACGPDRIEKGALLEFFQLKQDSGFEPWSNAQALLTSDLLEYLLINTLVNQLKTRYQVIARYRHGDGTYLFDENRVDLDSSETLEHLFASIDLLLVGRSTVAIEALMAGIPVITVSSLFQLEEVGTKDLRIPRLLWQPESPEELFDMVERRSRDDLDLAPDLSDYEALVRPSFFCGGEVDNSIENIVGVIKDCEPGTGATFDRKRYCELLEPSVIQRVILWFAATISKRIAYQATLAYLRLRKKWFPDAYLLHEAFIPETRSRS